MTLTAHGIGVVAGGATLVADAALTIAPGELVVLLGPNGAGKTSLLRAAIGLIPATGSAMLDGEPTAAMAPVARARALSYLPQMRPLAWPARVRDVVALGRFAHGVTLGRLSARDAEAVERALARCDLLALADRATDTLSGGELARVHLARALAAEAPLIVADEPVAALDPRHQHRVMGVLRDFVRDGGGALAVLHDLALAAAYADRLVWMKGGRVIAQGTVRETMTVERIAEVYRVRARIIDGDVMIDGLVERVLKPRRTGL